MLQQKLDQLLLIRLQFMMLLLILYIPHQVLFRILRIRERSVSRLPAGKSRKELLLLNELGTPELHIFHQIGQRH